MGDRLLGMNEQDHGTIDEGYLDISPDWDVITNGMTGP